MARKHEYAPLTNTPVMRGMPASLDNSIICGDCGDKMIQHMPNESVDLIYMDPPFFSGKNYEVIWKDGAEVRSFTDTDFYTLECKCGKVFPENYKFCPICGAGKDEATKRRSTDIGAYLQWLRPKFGQCYRVLKQTGSIYVHLDWHAVHYVKVMMDEIFGMNNFQSEIIWKRKGQSSRGSYGHNNDTVLYYTKSTNYTFNTQNVTKMVARPVIRNNRPCKTAPADGYSDERQMQMLNDGGAYRTKTGKIRQITYLDKDKDGNVIDIVPCDNIWDDIPNMMHTSKSERLGYPTQKPESLMARIIKASSNPGDIVLDPFCGCGTAVAVAQKLGRRWIGIDVSPTSCKAMSSRLHNIGYPINETGTDVLDMPQTTDQLRTTEPFEFQNWAVNQLGGRQTVRKSGDRGIDGFTFVGDPIQVKMSDKVDANAVRAFTQDVRDVDKTHAIIVAFSYSSGAYEEVDHIAAKYGIDIELKTVADLVD